MATITFAPFIRYKRADGVYPVRIRMTFHRKVREIPTNIAVDQTQITRSSLKIKDPAINRKIDDLTREMRDRASQINLFELERMSIDEVLSRIMRGDDFTLDFPTFANEQIDRKGNQRRALRSALKSFNTFLGRDHYDISVITSSTMQRWENWLTDKHGKGAASLFYYTHSIAHLHGLARKMYNDEEEGRILIRNPFSKYKCPKLAPPKHRNISPAIIPLMLLWRDQLTRRERLGVDVFLLSFALMGINSPDLMECTVRGDYVLYNRRKTRTRRADGAEMRVRIEPQLRWLVDEYLTKDGKRFSFYTRYSNYQSFGRSVDLGLHQFEKRLGLTTPLTLYVARHTFATVACSRACGIDKSVVNDMICHVDPSMRVTDIYVEKDWSVIWDANAKVQSFFDWTE